MAFLRADLGGGIDGQPAPQPQPLAGEIEGIKGGVLEHEQIALGIDLGTQGPDHLARIADVDRLVDHHHELGVGELGQSTPEGHRRPLGLAGIGLVDGDHRQLVAEGLHRQEEIDDLRDLLAQDRRVDAVEGDGEHRFLLGGSAAEGGQKHRITAVGDAVEAHQGRLLGVAVEAHVIAEGAIGQLLAGGDRALQHDLAVAGHLQVERFALHQPHPLAGIEPGEQPFTQLHRDRRRRRHDQQRMDADGNGDLQFLAQSRRLAQMAGAAAHAQPVHGHRRGGLLLQAIHAHIRHAGFRILGDHQPQGDHAARIRRPGTQQGQGIEIQLLPFEHHLVAGGGEIAVGPGFDQIPEHAGEHLELAQALGGAGLLQQGQPFPQAFELLRALHAHAPHHPFHRAQQVDGHGHRRADHVLKQQGRPTETQHPIGARRQLQVGVHRGGDAAQLAALL